MGANSGKQFTCAICSEKVTEDVARPDSCPEHIFHRKCLLKSASHSNQCPIDKKEFFEVIYEGGTRVIIQHQDSEDFQENPVIQELTVQVALNRLRMLQNFTCGICHGDDIMLGVVSPKECDHRFHKSCLLEAVKTDNHCPLCLRKVHKIICCNGENIEIEENKVRHIMAALSADVDFKCNICDSEDKFQERAFVRACKHEFHRECIVDYARHDSRCPLCSTEISEIACLYGSVLTVGSVRPSKLNNDSSCNENEEESDLNEKASEEAEYESPEKNKEETDGNEEGNTTGETRDKGEEIDDKGGN